MIKFSSSGTTSAWMIFITLHILNLQFNLFNSIKDALPSWILSQRLLIFFFFALSGSTDQAVNVTHIITFSSSFIR